MKYVKILLKVVLWAMLLAAAILLAAGWRPIQYCNAQCMNLRSLEQRAMGGDVVAIRDLYATAVSDVEASSLALDGALLGDATMQRAYIKYWKTYSPLEKASLLEILDEHNKLPHQQCFIKMLRLDAFSLGCDLAQGGPKGG